MKIVSPVILHMSFFEVVVDTLSVQEEWVSSQLNKNDLPAACFATRPEPPGRRRDGEWTGRKGSREEARHG